MPAPTKIELLNEDPVTCQCELPNPYAFQQSASQCRKCGTVYRVVWRTTGEPDHFSTWYSAEPIWVEETEPVFPFG